MADFKPKAVVFMLSGGDDSLAAKHVCRELGIKYDAVIHGNTRTGIPETTEFVRELCRKDGDRYIEADAGTSYVDYVMRKGFFGKGNGAHAFSYHILKAGHFRKVVSSNFRQNRRNYPILFLNGGRRQESENRMKNFISPYKRDPGSENNIWVNIINEFSDDERRDYLEGNSVERNPVAVKLCRSGECMCGTTQSEGDFSEAALYYPEWGANMKALRKAVKDKHGWDWGESMPKGLKAPKATETFQPMCVGCKMNQHQLDLSTPTKTS